jgi:hypothetical protein
MATAVETDFDRDSHARWYAQRHLDLDSGVIRIFYLPTDAPPREIRFLEVNGEIPEMRDPEPFNFGVAIDGPNAHKLYVLDVTPAQWDAIQDGKLRLPPGWTLEGSRDLGPQNHQ